MLKRALLATFFSVALIGAVTGCEPEEKGGGSTTTATESVDTTATGSTETTTTEATGDMATEGATGDAATTETATH
jgi:hypothetical protein